MVQRGNDFRMPDSSDGDGEEGEDDNLFGDDADNPFSSSPSVNRRRSSSANKNDNKNASPVAAETGHRSILQSQYFCEVLIISIWIFNLTCQKHYFRRSCFEFDSILNELRGQAGRSNTVIFTQALPRRPRLWRWRSRSEATAIRSVPARPKISNMGRN